MVTKNARVLIIDILYGSGENEQESTYLKKWVRLTAGR